MGVAKKINNFVRKINKKIGLDFVNKIEKPFLKVGEKIDDTIGEAAGMTPQAAPVPESPAQSNIEGDDVSTSVQMGRKRKGGGGQLARPVGTGVGSSRTSSTSVGLKV